MLKLGSLFDGIAGFPLAASRHGITPVWASEIESFCIRVSQARFPGMKHLGSVTDINGADAKAEGCEKRVYHDPFKTSSYCYGYEVSWDKIYAKKGFGWRESPWVWVVEFEL